MSEVLSTWLRVEGSHNFWKSFIHNTQLGMFTVKLNESLDNCPWIEYYIDDKGASSCDPFKSVITLKEIPGQPMHEICTVTIFNIEGRLLSKIVFIITHHDQEHLCSESRKAKKWKINDMLLPEMKKNIILNFCDGTLQELIFCTQCQKHWMKKINRDYTKFIRSWQSLRK